MTVKIDDKYLPFTAEQLAEHFAVVGGERRDRSVYTRYYEESAKSYAAWLRQVERHPDRRPLARDIQIEKDERFWVVAALMSLYHAQDRTDRLVQLLTTALGDEPPIPGFDGWNALLGASQHLFFEANLPAPRKYQDTLAKELDSRVFIPSHQSLAQRGIRATGVRLEGATKADALLVCDTGFSVLFEAKVLSDVSTMVSYDPTRNQLARCIDVALEQPSERADSRLQLRNPDMTCVVLLTPEVFEKEWKTRLYGWLYDAYKDDSSELLQHHLRHREQETDWAAVRQRLGWATWEDVHAIAPEGLGWIA